MAVVMYHSTIPLFVNDPLVQPGVRKKKDPYEHGNAGAVIQLFHGFPLSTTSRVYVRSTEYIKVSHVAYALCIDCRHNRIRLCSATIRPMGLPEPQLAVAAADASHHTPSRAAHELRHCPSSPHLATKREPACA